MKAQNKLTPMAPWERGTWAGVIATSSMTAAMLQLFQALPRQDKTPLPPAILTEEIEEQVGLQKGNRLQGAQATLALHFAYGAVGGLIYSALFDRFRTNPILKGSFFGLGVWAGSYLGWIPMLGFKPSAFKTTADRNALMIIVHLIWGGTLGWADQQLKKNGSQSLAASRTQTRSKY